MTTGTHNATDTSKRSMSTKKRGKRTIRRKKRVQTSVSTFQSVLHDDVTVACRPFGFRPWRSVSPLVVYLRRKGFRVNAVLNRALLFYLNAEASDSGLRDEARLCLLLREEQRLIHLNRVMLRSGAYLDLYADKVLRGGKARLDAKLGRKPLAALAPREEPIFKRMIARREAVVKEIREILARRLPKPEYVLKEDRIVRRRSRSRAHLTKQAAKRRLGAKEKKNNDKTL